MIGQRLKRARIDRGYTLEELGNIVGKSQSTLSRLENEKTTTLEPNLLVKLADALSVSTLYLLGNHEDIDFNENMMDYLEKDQFANVVVKDAEMSPEVPKGASMNIRPMQKNEKLQIGSFYYIEFNNKKCFRMAVADATHGVGFLPINMSERRIAFDKEYVKIHGKAISMKVVFDDHIEYE